MKFCVNSRELARAIGPSVEVATKNCVKEHAYEGLITIKVGKKGIGVLSFGGRASLIAFISDSTFGSLDYDCKEEGEVTVYASDFLNSLITMESGNVEVKLSSNEVVVTLLSNKSNKRSMATVKEIVKPPNIGKKFEQKIEVDRGTFVKGLNSVTFAPAVEDKMFSYQCVLVETFSENKEQTIRFSAGTGGRFAIKALERVVDKATDNKGVYTIDEDVKIIFPKNNLSSICNVMSNINSERVIISTIEQDSKDNIPEQIKFEADGVVLCVFGMENFTKYPDLTKIIEHKYSNRIYSDLKDWNFAVGGVGMTKRGHDSKIHNTEVVFDLDEKRFVVTPKTAHACETIVPIADDKHHTSVVKGEKIWFRCNSVYLEEMMNRDGKTGRIQFNFDSQESLNDIPDDKPKQMRPVLIKFHEKSDEPNNIKEKFYMFFTVSTKE